jgi:hypothetical protein
MSDAPTTTCSGCGTVYDSRYPVICCNRVSDDGAASGIIIDEPSRVNVRADGVAISYVRVMGVESPPSTLTVYNPDAEALASLRAAVLGYCELLDLWDRRGGIEAHDAQRAAFHRLRSLAAQEEAPVAPHRADP